ncbi:hypothetical protein Pmar_PMAR018551 [Perkinsus marinus ATCC 50983]|uniref:CCHC-type domain-containing protein n=1 Tax=Perkinsus marinus (strain ATCC 50983 / TXsc) TaxID=423536 RepID=C5L049_PERM5|nr:hypothetical protein Pmar_PMAR018551 [Perkinsus marinus ATCC 50983]EER09907.1 hypothetical protein Pmar_PMAR018551 [Perkinsus marinus ATCC 50983]|eukprot:XP_002778112.1 hypothetical protein Pmar_PMAR018551 [Perkinsus marinus ATCC 50983]
MNDNDTNPGVAIHQPDQEFGTGNYPYDTSLSSGYQLQSMHYPDNVHLSRPVSIRRFPTTREHIRPVHPNTGTRQGHREVTLPSNDRLHRHQEVVTSSNVKSTEGYREVSLPSIDRLHHHQEVVKSSNVKPIGDHREVIVPSTDRPHRHQEVVMSSNDRPIHDRPYEQQGHQLDHGRVSKPPVTDDRTTIKGSYVRQENLIKRQVGYERAQEHPLQANVASLNGQHRLRESILSNLRVSDKILYNEFYLDMITKDRELLYNIIQDDYLRPIFLSHPIIIEKSMSDPNFLNIEHYPNPIKDSQHSEQHQSCGTVIKDYSSAAASSTLTVDGSRPQQSVPIYDTTVKDITTADDRVPLEQVDSTKPVEVISISSAAKNGSRSHHENYREHHQQPSPRAAMRSTRRRDPSGSPSGSSDSSGDDHDSRRSRRSHQRRRRSLSSSSSSSSPSSASGRALSRPYPTLKHLPGITSGRMYRPPNLFGNKTYDRCPGCRHTKCRHKISDKDLQIATNTAKGLAIKNHYQGADDRRSGAAWIQEIFKRTVGQRNLVRYTFARLNTINTVWDDLVRDETDPALCHKDYDRHWDLLINKINEFYSDQEVLLKLQNDFNHLQQEPKETVNQFISRLDGYANQLCLLGVSILDDIIKRRLYDGLLNDRLRDKMDRDVDDHRIDYPRFKRQLIKYDRRRQGRLSKKEADPATLRLYGGRHPDQRRQATVSNIVNNDHSDDYHDGSPIPSGSSTDDDVYYVYAVVRDQQSITCYRCLQDGHPARNCTNDIGKKDERCIRCGNPTHTIDKCNVSTTATCHRCGREGHLAYVCPDPLPSPTVSMRSKGGKGKGKGIGKGKGKSPGPSSIQATTSSTTDGNLQQLPTPPTPEVKISGVDPNENNDDSSDANNEYDIYNDAQTNMIVSHHYPESSILTVSESVPNQLKTMKANSSDKVFGDPKVTSTSNICSSSTSSTRCDVVVGVIKIGPETRPVLFDTGADISLIAIGALEKIFGGDCPIFSSTTNSNVKVANTTSIKVIGHVSIPIETRHIKITERFAVTDNSLSSPVILGCPALQQLQCAIVFTVSGSVVFTGIEDLTSSFHRQIYKTISRSAKQRQPAEIKGFGDVSITHQPTSHVVRVVNDDLPTSSCSTIMASNDVTTHLDLLHGGIWNGKVTNNNAVPRIMNSIPDVITNDPYGATDMEDVPLHPDLQLQSDPTDDLPPWEVIKRQWIPDFSAPLGRCQLSVPWLSSDRPDHNFRIAARRGAASVQRLSPEEKDLFHQSLKTFIDRKSHTIDCYSFAAHIYEGHHKLFDPNKNFTSWVDEQHQDQPEALKKLLGYLFRRSSDLLHAVYEADRLSEEDCITKRKASSYLLSLYDPLGLVLEHTMVGRLIWRKITEATTDWDAKITDDHRQQVSDWVNASINLCNDAKYGVPRFVDINNHPVVLSVDASLIAWGIDLRCLSSPNDRLMSRAGLFPKSQKNWSIPRKELDALWRGLKWIKNFSIYLPIKTNLNKSQQPLHPLRPNPPLNPADPLSRAKVGIYCYDDKIKNAVKVATVLYDYLDSVEDPSDDPLVISDPPLADFVATAITVNPDGIPLPDLSTIEDVEQRAELQCIWDYAKHRYTPDEDPPVDTIEFTEAVEICARRCQLLDDDLRLLKLYLEGKLNLSDAGSRYTHITRLATICELDANKIIRRCPQEADWKRVHEDPHGVIFLGGSNYANILMVLLTIIFHYVYLHRAHRKITGQLQRRYNGKRLPIIVKNTIASCIPCLRSKAYRGLNYVSRSVQALATKSIWQVCGADIVGPYQRDEAEQGSTRVLTRKRYILLVHDAITSFTCSRILYDATSLSVADAFHSIWCEMGAPSVLITDKDMSGFINRHVKNNLISHGIRHLVLPPYSPHLSFWERIHRDFVQMSRSICCQVNSENDYIKSYLLAIRAYNCTAKDWIPFTPASLHLTYHQRLPGDPPASSDIINYGALAAGTINSDQFGFARAMLPFVKEIQQEVSSTVAEYIEFWYHKQAAYRRRINLSTEMTYPDPKPFDIVFITNYSDIGWAINNKMKSRWEGPFTIAKVTSSATVLVAPELILPNRKIWERSNSSSSSPTPPFGPTSPSIDNSGPCSSTDHRSPGPTNITDDHDYDSGIDRLFKDHELQLVSLKNVVHAKAFQDLVRDQHLRGQRIYVDHRGAIRSIDSLKDESRDLQRVRELITEGAINDALKAWRSPTTTTSNDESLSEGDQDQGKQPQGHSIPEDLHQAQKDDQLTPSDSPDLIPENAHPSRVSKPRTSRNRHQQDKEKTGDQHDPTAIKPTPTKTKGEFILARSEMIKRGFAQLSVKCILHGSPHK